MANLVRVDLPLDAAPAPETLVGLEHPRFQMPTDLPPDEPLSDAASNFLSSDSFHGKLARSGFVYSDLVLEEGEWKEIQRCCKDVQLEGFLGPDAQTGGKDKYRIGDFELDSDDEKHVIKVLTKGLKKQKILDAKNMRVAFLSVIGNNPEGSKTRRTAQQPLNTASAPEGSLLTPLTKEDAQGRFCLFYVPLSGVCRYNVRQKDTFECNTLPIEFSETKCEALAVHGDAWHGLAAAETACRQLVFAIVRKETTLTKLPCVHCDDALSHYPDDMPCTDVAIRERYQQDGISKNLASLLLMSIRVDLIYVCARGHLENNIKRWKALLRERKEGKERSKTRSGKTASRTPAEAEAAHVALAAARARVELTAEEEAEAAAAEAREEEQGEEQGEEQETRARAGEEEVDEYDKTPGIGLGGEDGVLLPVRSNLQDVPSDAPPALASRVQGVRVQAGEGNGNEHDGSEEEDEEEGEEDEEEDEGKQQDKEEGEEEDEEDEEEGEEDPFEDEGKQQDVEEGEEDVPALELGVGEEECKQQDMEESEEDEEDEEEGEDATSTYDLINQRRKSAEAAKRENSVAHAQEEEEVTEGDLFGSEVEDEQVDEDAGEEEADEVDEVDENEDAGEEEEVLEVDEDEDEDAGEGEADEVDEVDEVDEDKDEEDVEEVLEADKSAGEEEPDEIEDEQVDESAGGEEPGEVVRAADDETDAEADGAPASRKRPRGWEMCATLCGHGFDNSSESWEVLFALIDDMSGDGCVNYLRSLNLTAYEIGVTRLVYKKARAQR